MISVLFIQLHLARLGHGSCYLFSPSFLFPKSCPQSAFTCLGRILPSWRGTPAYQKAQEKPNTTERKHPPTSLCTLEAAPSAGPSMYQSQVGSLASLLPFHLLPCPGFSLLPSSSSSRPYHQHLSDGSLCILLHKWPHAPTGAGSRGPRGSCARDGAPFGASGLSAGYPFPVRMRSSQTVLNPSNLH